MRIVGGERRGLTLTAPKGVDTRPTAARTREAVFNRLDHGLARADGRPPYADALVVDACCGAGAMALEALSRGAARAFLIDSAPAALAAARRNATAAGYADRCRFAQADAAEIGLGETAGAIFVDPPYRLDAAPFAAKLAAALAEDGVMVVETAAKTKVAPPAALRLIDDRRYGAARVSFFARVESVAIR